MIFRPLELTVRVGALAACLIVASGCQMLRIANPARLPAQAQDSGRFHYSAGETIAPSLTEVWRYNAQAGFGPGPPLVVDDLVFVGARQGEVHAIKLSTGDKAGARELGEAVNGSLAYGSTLLFVPIAWGGNAIVAYDLVTGSTAWEAEGAPVGGGVRISGDLVFAADSRGTVTAYHAITGELRWRRSLEGASYSGAPVILGADRILVAAENGQVNVLSVTDGSGVWEATLPAAVYATPTAGEEYVYVPTTQGLFFALDSSTGSVEWSIEAPDPTVRYTPPAMADGRLYVGRSDGAVVALDADTGMRIWQYLADDAISAPPFAAGAYVYVGTMGARLVALDAGAGRRVWSRELAGRVKSAMASSNGKLLVLAEPRYVYLFE